MSIANLLNQTCVIYPTTSYNSQGREVAGTGVTVSCRAQNKRKNVFTAKGALLTIDLMLDVGPSTTVEVDNKVVFSGTNYKVYSKYNNIGRFGETNHITLGLIRWQTT